MMVAAGDRIEVLRTRLKGSLEELMDGRVPAYEDQWMPGTVTRMDGDVPTVKFDDELAGQMALHPRNAGRTWRRLDKPRYSVID